MEHFVRMQENKWCILIMYIKKMQESVDQSHVFLHSIRM